MLGSKGIDSDYDGVETTRVNKHLYAQSHL